MTHSSPDELVRRYTMRSAPPLDRPVVGLLVHGERFGYLSLAAPDDGPELVSVVIANQPIDLEALLDEALRQAQDEADDQFVH